MSDIGKVGLGIGIADNTGGDESLGRHYLHVIDPMPSSDLDDRSKHYPYDCKRPHCTDYPESCVDSCCEKRIENRKKGLRAMYSPLPAEIERLKSEAKMLADLAWERWEEKIELRKENEEDIGGYFEIQHGCPSCYVENLRRHLQVLKLNEGLLRFKIASIKEYIELREREEAHEQDRLEPLEDEIADLRRSASELRQELESLDEDCDHSEIDRSTGKSSALSESFSRRVESALSPEPSSADECSCKICLAKKKGVLLRSALAFGEASKKKLEGIVDEAWNGPGSVNYEREQTRRQAAANTQLFGRTGSYRGHGAGALKARERQLNPQTKGGKKKK